MKIERAKIFQMYGGCCAYCGELLTSRFQVDHVHPKRIAHHEPEKDIDRPENLKPACFRCNNWKAGQTLEQFRHDISQQVIRARAYSRNFRMAEKFNLVEEIKRPVKFYFEIYEERENLQHATSGVTAPAQGPSAQTSPSRLKDDKEGN